MPINTARSVRSSSHSISTLAKVRVSGSPELGDPVGSLQVGEHQDVQEFGPEPAGQAGRSAEGLDDHQVDDREPQETVERVHPEHARGLDERAELGDIWSSGLASAAASSFRACGM
jgi:hypothetical protein